MFFKSLYNLGDKAEDKVRARLSHFPIVYAFLGGAGIIMFWRGIWHTMDYLMQMLFVSRDSASADSISQIVWWDGPLSILIRTTVLLLSGLFVTSFIGNEIIISGLKGEKKLTEKTEEDVRMDLEESSKMKREMRNIDDRLSKIEKILSRIK
jgi:hypothetical protein